MPFLEMLFREEFLFRVSPLYLQPSISETQEFKKITLAKLVPSKIRS